MAITYGFFLDPALTTPIVSRLQFVHGVTGPAAVDKRIYFGSPIPGRLARATSAPGIDPITVGIVDAAPGTGLPASTVRLALSAAGLESATPGAALALPVEVAGGPGNAVPIYLRVLQSGQPAGVSIDLSIAVSSVSEYG